MCAPDQRQRMLLMSQVFLQTREYPYHQKYQRDFDVEARVEGRVLDLQAGVISMALRYSKVR
jgi:hypothetical protein